MFKFFKTLKTLRENFEDLVKRVDNLDFEVLPADVKKELYGDSVLESRVHSVEYKLDALLKHLKLVAEEGDMDDEYEVTLRKRTKKDDKADKDARAERLGYHFLDF